MSHRILSLVFLFFIVAPSMAQDTQRQYLSGKGIDDAVPWEFMVSSDLKSGQWTTIPVPWGWDTLGLGMLTSGRADALSNEQGKYRHRFQVPADWAGRRVLLVFEGSMTD